jgi:hypothetical protein
LGHSKDNAFIKKSDRSQINNLMMHLKFLEKQKQTKPKATKRNYKDSGRN